MIASAIVPLAPSVATPNDNRQSAGSLTQGVLTLDLEARAATWKPEGTDGPGLDVAAFAETGKEAQVPGPLVRVRAGTRVNATVRNTFPKPLVVFGLGARGVRDSIVVPARGRQSVSFVLAKPGTFFYFGRTELEPFGGRSGPEQSLNGAIVVDSATAPSTPRDRVLLISWYSTVDLTSPNGLGRTTMTINGLSWPHTERLDYAQGDSVHWRVINVSDLDHPMHLHGFYFRLESRGDGVTDSVYPREQQRMAVTEILDPFRTLAMSWKAERPGNWIFHCHYALHLSESASLDMEKGTMKRDAVGHHGSDVSHQMFGLVMGLRVAARGATVQMADPPPRPIRVLMREKQNVYGNQPGFSFVVGGSRDESDQNAMPVPGQPLVLERGKPVAITVVNTSTEHASVHWHGIELESYPDGVPGWSGSGTTVLPSIKPGDSITVHYTPPRAGTFMYHSHMNEAMQMGGGAYGPIIVVEPGEKFDPATDKVLFFGTAGILRNFIKGPFPDYVLNGERQPAPMTLAVGTRYRFRLFNLAGDAPTFVSLNSGATPIQWTFVAKDGYSLPPAQIREQPAELLFDPGEIYDFEYTPTAPGELTLLFGPPPSSGPAPALPPGFFPQPPRIQVSVIVR